jgi:hypothetical protein
MAAHRKLDQSRDDLCAGEQICIDDTHRGDGKHFVVREDEKADGVCRD